MTLTLSFKCLCTAELKVHLTYTRPIKNPEVFCLILTTISSRLLTYLYVKTYLRYHFLNLNKASEILVLESWFQILNISFHSQKEKKKKNKNLTQSHQCVLLTFIPKLYLSILSFALQVIQIMHVPNYTHSSFHLINDPSRAVTLPK